MNDYVEMEDTELPVLARRTRVTPPSGSGGVFTPASGDPGCGEVVPPTTEPRQEEKFEVTLHIRRAEELSSDEDFDELPPSECGYLSPAEFEKKHGISDKDLEVLWEFAKAHDFRECQEHRAERMFVLKDATRAKVWEAFGVELIDLEDASGSFRGYQGRVRLPEELQHIVEDVTGLEDRSTLAPVMPEGLAAPSCEIFKSTPIGGNEVPPPPPDRVSGGTSTGDGTWSPDGGGVPTRPAPLGTPIRVNSPHEFTVMAVTPDASWAICVHAETLVAWKTKDGTGLHPPIRLEGHTGTVYALAVTPDGRVVSGSEDGTVRIWDLAEQKQQHQFEHGAAVSAVAVAPNGKFVLSGSDDETVRVWDLDSGQQVGSIEVWDAVNQITISDDGRYVFILSDHGVRVWEPEDMIKQVPIDPEPDQPQA